MCEGSFSGLYSNIYLLQSGDSLAMNSGMQHDFIDGDDTISKLTGFTTILVVFLT